VTTAKIPTRPTTARVALRRPKGTSQRARLVVHMHPKQLRALMERAAQADMSLSAYVEALLESDVEDVPGARRTPKFSLWDALTKDAP
jgi:hypothetical protein